MNKIFPQLGIISLVALFTLFMIVGNTFIYKHQRSINFDAFKESQQTEIKLLSQMAREGLISQNFALLEWFFRTYALDYDKVVSLSLKNQNGFALSQYQRRKAAQGDTITATNTITLHDGTYIITLTSDTVELKQKMEELELQLFLVNAGASLLVIVNIWFLFRHFAIRRLQHETRLRRMAEEKLRKLELDKS